MPILIAVSSIFAIAGLAWLLNKILPFKICPVCAGVAGTWLWMFAGMLAGFLSTTDYQLPTAVLMGGSAVGIAYQIERRLPPGRSTMRWKLIFIPGAFAAAYSLLSSELFSSFSSVAALALIVLIFFRHSPGRTHEAKKAIESLKKKMKACC